MVHGIKQNFPKTFALMPFRVRMLMKALEAGPRVTSDRATEVIRAMDPRTNYSQQQKQPVDGIKRNLKTNKVKVLAVELLRQTTTHQQKVNEGEMSCPDSDDLYSDETTGWLTDGDEKRLAKRGRPGGRLGAPHEGSLEVSGLRARLPPHTLSWPGRGVER